MRCLKPTLSLLCLILIAASASVWAQSTGTIAGTITDPSGAVVPGAQITLTDPSTGTARTVNTNTAGDYLFIDVNPGKYNLSINKQGFANTKATAEVKVGLTVTINLALEVGAQSTVVEVQAVGNELQMMNSTVGNDLTSATLDALPSIGRDVSTFVELQPGVTPEGSVAGTVNDQTYFSLDGGNNTNDMDGNMSTYTATYAGDPTGGVANQSFGVTGAPTGVLPTPQDSVEEFKVNTANQTVDFNSSSGAEVKIATKRGTNTWHGTAYEYYLDNNWSSNSWDNNFNKIALPSFHYSRFGAAAGGPIIPKEFAGGKTYLFYNYEGFRFPDSETIFRDVPSTNLEQGLLTDPTTNATIPLTSVDPLGKGIDPMIQQLWTKYEPKSNAACHNSLCDGANVLGYAANVSLPQTSNFMATRLDHDFSDKWHLMTSYRYYNLKKATTDQVDIGGFFPGDTLGTPASHSNDPQQAWYLVAGLTTNISPSLTNDFHYSFLRNWWAWGRAGDVPQLPGLGGALEVFAGESQTQDLMPYNVNTQQTRTRFWDGHDQMLRDDLSLLKGNHLFQFGGIYQHNFNWHQRTDNGGGINYQPVYQLGLGSSGSGLASALCGASGTSTANVANCDSLAAAALGIVSISQVAYTRSGTSLTLNPPLTPAFDQSTIPYYNVYFSDSWHMKKTFTFTYGLGWTLEMPPTEAQGKQVELVDSSDQPINLDSYLSARKRAALEGQVYNPEVGFALVGNTENGLKYPYNPFYGEFSPRIAAAWNPHFDADSFAGKIFGSDSSVIRGGYGRIYGRLNGVDLVLVPLLGTGLMQPVQCLANLSSGLCGAGGTATGSTAFRIGVNGLTAPLSTDPSIAPSTNLVQPDYPGFNAIAAGAGEALDPNFRPNVVDSFDLTFQRQLSRKLILEVGYIGRIINHEYQPVNINAVPYMMTLGGQQFQTAYANIERALGCAGPVSSCGAAVPSKTLPNSTAPNPAYGAYINSIASQPFFQAALVPAKCSGTFSNGTGSYANCTAAVIDNELSDFTSQQVWSLWSNLDSGYYNFPRSMMNTPIPCPTTSCQFGGQGQLTSGIGINASVGHGNYNAGFASLKMADWKGLTMQSNFTWSKALGTGAEVQATSEYTPNDAFNINNMYGPQFFNRKFVYNTFLVYDVPFYKGQEGAIGRLLGGWSISPIFTTGSGQPIEIFTTTGNGQEFGAGDNVSFFGNETAVPVSPISNKGHAYYTPGSPGFGDGGLPVNIFKNPEAAFNSYRNPILGIDNRDTPFLTGLPYWNLDLSIRKNVRVAERLALEFQGVFTNVLNHNQFLDPWGMGLSSPSSFGNLLGSAQETTGGNRSIQLGARVRF